MRNRILLATLLVFVGASTGLGQVSGISSTRSFKMQVLRNLKQSDLNRKQKVAQYQMRLGGGFRPPMVTWDSYPDARIDVILAEKLDSEFDRRAQVNGRIEAVVTANFPIAAWSHGEVLENLSAAERAFKECSTDNCAERLRSLNKLRTDIVQAEQARKLIHMILDDSGLLWQLEDFWFNHFNIHARKSMHDIADYRRKMRPAIFGKFEDLLLLTAKHPAMLVYLDNRFNTRNNLNENFGREVMELHTLGKGPQRFANEPTGSYTQADVENAAKILTGWGIGPQTANGREFLFSPEKHLNAPATIMGKEFNQQDFEQGRQFLLYLANHPVTAKNICRKLVRRFVHDNPDHPDIQPLVNQMISRFQSSGGDLLLVYQEMIANDIYWSAAALRTQWKKPSLAVVSALRQMGITADDINTQNVLRWIGVIRNLGEDLLLQTPPTGYSDFNKDWINANGAVLWSKFLATETEAYVDSPKYPVFEGCLKHNTADCQKAGLGPNPTATAASLSGLREVFSLDPGFGFHHRLAEDIPWLTQSGQSDSKSGVTFPLRSVLEYYMSTPDFLRY